MILITKETFMHRDIYYKKEVDDSGKVVSCKRYDCKTFVFKDKNGKDMIFIGDRLDMLRPLPFEYVNEIRKNTSLGCRIQMATALQLFYTFCDIYRYHPDDFSGMAADSFVRFVEGKEVAAEPGSAPVLRAVKTINSTLGMVRKFLTTFGFDKSVKGFGMLEYYKGTIRTDGGRTFRINMKHMNTINKKENGLRKLKAPKHYTPAQAKQLAKLMKEANDYQTYNIFRLGTELGMRRGEILGLTTEDVKRNVNSHTGEINYKIILRNRLSDTKDQCAKNLPHVNSQEEYKTSTYRKYSCEEIDITESLYNMIMRYYEESRDINKIGIKAHNALLKATEADTVYSNGRKNYYIFFTCHNGKYNILSGQTLNNHLKEYFDMAGIELDNVSHAMRHSFAMFHAYYAKHPLTQLQLQVLMRHASAESTAIYFNLPDEEIKRLRDEYSTEMELLIPDYNDFK